MTQILDELSGSYLLKPQHEDFKAKIKGCDEKIAQETEILQGLRLEKVKLKGL